MSNTYTLTQQIHSELDRVKTKHDLKFKVESKSYLLDTGELFTSEVELKTLPKAIQPPQIRQILVGLSDVLGENPIVQKAKDRSTISEANGDDPEYKFYDFGGFFCSPHYAKPNKYVDEPESFGYVNQAEALCQKWLDGLYPLFDREPETVLQELLEILETL